MKLVDAEQCAGFVLLLSHLVCGFVRAIDFLSITDYFFRVERLTMLP